MRKALSRVLEYALLIIITTPAFSSLLNPQYFTMHDDQHIARLYVLTQGIQQGALYPRWVDLFGFNMGYPLFNFYPPFVYYIGLVFHLIGASFIWSVKLTFISGFILGSLGMYKWLNRKIGKVPSYVAACLYTYFTYHAVNIYVRGALAEFYTITTIPFILWAMDLLYEKATTKRVIFLGGTIALLILNHPLIAFPATMVLGIYFLHLLFTSKNKSSFVMTFIGSGALGLALSAFFWLPSMLERTYTLVDTILTHELASYSIHFIYPSQLWYSPWGYGGSGAGYADGMSFQLGKLFIGLLIFSVITYLISLTQKNSNEQKRDYRGYLLLLIFSLFMTLPYSKWIWDHVKYLWYLQFPWRFLTFVTIFMSACIGYGIYFFGEFMKDKPFGKYISVTLSIFVLMFSIATYQKYFHPQKYVDKIDQELTSFDEITWRVSSTSFEFAPIGLPLKKSQYNTSILDISKSQIPRASTEIIKGKVTIAEVQNSYKRKRFVVDSQTLSEIQLNTFYFPGWKAYVDNKEVAISNSNTYQNMQVVVPEGKHTLTFSFENTLIRNIATWISYIAVAVTALLLVTGKLKKEVS